MNKEFALRLKFLRKNIGYTQKDVAKLLNLGQTTIANYENNTRIPDIEKIVEIADLFDISIDSLLGQDKKKAKKNRLSYKNRLNASELNYETYLNCLLNGDKERAIVIGLSLFEDRSLSRFYQDIIQRSFIEIGVLWEKGDLDVWKEHLISEISMDMMRILNYRFYPSKTKDKTILFLTPGPELHNIGLRMVCDLFKSKGWDSIFLGSNLPTQSVLKAIQEKKPHVLALSITMPSHIDSAQYLIHAIREHDKKIHLPIMIGGSALNHIDNITEFMGADYYFKNLDDLPEQLDTLK